MGRLSCGRDAVFDRLGVVEGAVSTKRLGPVSNPFPIIRATGTGPCPEIRATGTGPCPKIRGTGTGPCSVVGATRTGGQRRVR